MNKSISFNILNTEWSICLVDANDSVLFETDGKMLLGKTNNVRNEIHIVKDLSASKFAKVLIHELTHAFIFQLLLGKQEFTHEEVAEFNEEYHQEINFLFEKIMTMIRRGGEMNGKAS